MKKFFYFAAALALVACSNSTYTGNADLNVPVDPEGAINFSFSKSGMKKVDGIGQNLAGGDAANALNGRFVVYGTKHAAVEDGTAANDAVVFDNFQVAYFTNTAGTTETNTANWDYAGLTAYSAAVTTPQAVKYWDLSTVSHTFYAFSSTNISYPADATNDKVVVTKTTTGTDVYKKGFEVTIKEGAKLDSLFFSDRTVVNKADYGQTVSLVFRSLGAKVRVGFYETVPGYDVKIDQFYFASHPRVPYTTFGTMTETGAEFKASVQNIKAAATGADNVLTVNYFDGAAAPENRVSITNSGATSQYTLALGDQITAATKLGETSAAATFDKAAGAYTSIYPMEGNATDMLIRLDYTLTSTDGTNDVIHVKNARVVVPAEYVQWKANTAYTYLFKISNNTNGTTGNPSNPDDPTNPIIPVIDPVTGDTTGYVDPTDPVHPNDTIPLGPTDPFPDTPTDPTKTPDPEGLFPITFDAVVAATEDGLQQTITTVATNNVTTYAEGRIGDEYKATKPIYVVNTNTNTHAVVAPTALGTAATQVKVYKLNKACTEAELLAQLTGHPMGITLTDASAALIADGKFSVNGMSYNFGANGAVSFTPAAAGIYAYVYCKTAHVDVTYAAAPATYVGSLNYYFKAATANGDFYYLATGINDVNYDANKANLYVVDTTAPAGVAGNYDVKVIKVQ